MVQLNYDKYKWTIISIMASIFFNNINILKALPKEGDKDLDDEVVGDDEVVDSGKHAPKNRDRKRTQKNRDGKRTQKNRDGKRVSFEDFPSSARRRITRNRERDEDVTIRPSSLRHQRSKRTPAPRYPVWIAENPNEGKAGDSDDESSIEDLDDGGQRVDKVRAAKDLLKSEAKESGGLGRWIRSQMGHPVWIAENPNEGEAGDSDDESSIEDLDEQGHGSSAIQGLQAPPARLGGPGKRVVRVRAKDRLKSAQTR